ncbi:hypothetical protein [Gloeobacter kilaueensis]|uniref:Uncharacterized protein n=1 Tax=Gloeobacter kilaueensis (strain ATCC BAA-2537 / CCAP 1431/1 / ULC 316 / JS1) TaxID=1183438 RepID=U5QJU0_GLOK1|nr:hypothetical protein [Gloeobacter kilaueensis]AGY59257.1 hypothetical protein GKIL_3011 [Gloeobacter kilaueensis JS1]
MSDPLQEFLRHNAPQPPEPGIDLEDHIIARTLAPAVHPWYLRRPPLIAAASLALLLLGSLGLWQQQQQQRPILEASKPAETATLAFREPDTFFAVDPQTGLYDVQF